MNNQSTEADLGETYRAWDEMKKQKRWENHENSLELLEKFKVEYVRLSTTHYRIGEYDFWPTTGLFVHRKTQKRGRGVFRLLEKVVL